MSPVTITRMIIGIDPGFSGAIATLNSTNGYGSPKLKTELCDLTVWDMPLIQINGRPQVDAKQFAHKLRYMTKIHKVSIQFAAVEDVHAMPEQGVVSTFRFGYNAGILLGVLQALNIKVLRIKPNVWKPALGLSRDKNDSLKLARKLFPRYSKKYFTRKKDDGRAEAALLAHFARECCS